MSRFVERDELKKQWECEHCGAIGLKGALGGWWGCGRSLRLIPAKGHATAHWCPAHHDECTRYRNPLPSDIEQVRNGLLTESGVHDDH